MAKREDRNRSDYELIQDTPMKWKENIINLELPAPFLNNMNQPEADPKSGSETKTDIFRPFLTLLLIGCFAFSIIVASWTTIQDATFSLLLLTIMGIWMVIGTTSVIYFFHKNKHLNTDFMWTFTSFHGLMTTVTLYFVIGILIYDMYFVLEYAECNKYFLTKSLVASRILYSVQVGFLAFKVIFILSQCYLFIRTKFWALDVVFGGKDPSTVHSRGCIGVVIFTNLILWLYAVLYESILQTDHSVALRLDHTNGTNRNTLMLRGCRLNSTSLYSNFERHFVKVLYPCQIQFCLVAIYNILHLRQATERYHSYDEAGIPSSQLSFLKMMKFAILKYTKWVFSAFAASCILSGNYAMNRSSSTRVQAMGCFGGGAFGALLIVIVQFLLEVCLYMSSEYALQAQQILAVAMTWKLANLVLMLVAILFVVHRYKHQEITTNCSSGILILVGIIGNFLYEVFGVIASLSVASLESPLSYPLQRYFSVIGILTTVTHISLVWMQSKLMLVFSAHRNIVQNLGVIEREAMCLIIFSNLGRWFVGSSMEFRNIALRPLALQYYTTTVWHTITRLMFPFVLFYYLYSALTLTHVLVG